MERDGGREKDHEMRWHERGREKRRGKERREEGRVGDVRKRR